VLSVSATAAIDLVIGLAFFYFLLSVVCSSINEAIMTTLNQRAKDLESGLRNLLGGKVDGFYKNPRIEVLFKPRRVLGGDKKPSYISPQLFTLTMLDLFENNDGSGQGTLVARAEAILANADLPVGVKSMLNDAITAAGSADDRFRASVEASYDELMDRVTGWYKRRAQLFLFAIALILAIGINADSYAVGQRLWKDDALRTAVAANAAVGAGKGTPKCALAPDGKTPLPHVQAAAICTEAVKQLNLPLGWATATTPHGWRILAKIPGFLITAFAVMLGAPFWFDLLGKVSNLRGAGTATKAPVSPTPAVAVNVAPAASPNLQPGPADAPGG
jgi:hypothetical protein